MSGHKWISHSKYSSAPGNAVVAGHDSDGARIYVGRTYFEGNLLPCKVMPDKNAAYVSYNGTEVGIDDYELFVKSEIHWIPSSNGHVPEGAIPGGHTANGETLYIGRVNHNNSLTLGKIHPSHNCIYIPYGEQELSFNDYEVMTYQ